MDDDMKKFRKGDVIFREGEFQMWMYDLLYGSVALYVDYGTPEEVMVGTNNAPTFFGEVGLLESMPRFATAVALEECVCRIIRHDDITGYFEKNPAKIVSILESLSSRLSLAYRMFGFACRTFEDFVGVVRENGTVSDELKSRMIQFSRGAKKIKTNRPL